MRNLDRLVLVFGLLVLAGCNRGSGTTANTGTPNYAQGRAMSELYANYLQSNRGQPPADEAAFRSFLGGKQDALDRAGLTVDEMFVSPRNGQGFAWSYGKPGPVGQFGVFYGYETSSTDGKRMALAARGMYELMDEAKFRTLFSQTQ